jgi:serine/threonine-protein kinase HipA
MDILVYADWIGLNGPALMGTLTVVHTKGRAVFSFAYDKDWIKKGEALDLDPDLQFFGGPQYLPEGKKNFGIFLDSSPDRWGRVLIARKEAIKARMEGKKEKALFEEEYLLSVLDDYRMGAIRFKTNGNGPFLNNDAFFTSPPMASLKELEYASFQLEKDLKNDKESLKWINMLINPGGSLGGARPKASITGPDGLWIAKFPSLKDATDIGGWERVTELLARTAGLYIAEGFVRKYNNHHHTFLSKRFDRTASNDRIHFASAMTLLGRTDGEEGASYLDLAEFIRKRGANVDKDLEELWRRIVFYISVKNTDDHLRNHGFIFKPGSGWALSPAFDVNPVYHGTGLTLNVSETDNSLDLDLAQSVAKYFRVSSSKAEMIIGEVKQAVSGWQKIAEKLSIPRNEQELMSMAFEKAKI